METTHQLALTQMRESVEKLGSSCKKYGDQTLLRFLIARSMDPVKAAKMFVQWQKWRADFVPNGSIPASEVPDELEPKKVYLQSLSKDTYPVAIVKASKHFPSKDQLQFKSDCSIRFQRNVTNENSYACCVHYHYKTSAGFNIVFPLGAEFVVHLLDKIIASSFKGSEIGNEKLIAILDLQHIAYKNIDARGLITGFQFLQAYYPERLAKCYILHMPWFFVSVWRMVSRFLEKATLEKIVIVTNDEERLDFVKQIGEEVLPEEYGGRAKLVPIQDVVLPPLES
ncbi:hypothetical protein Tsubulata_027400 [Turnera subulata]|uniref:CRAL-TRIO domain-containing protein n=1 Tax=Turnera subulata TaxID=218843 RepID=A0A9Q0JKK5_9ROSI|nr:hypothetical protein Tsubulata_027400 [Turnera subulata]